MSSTPRVLDICLATPPDASRPPRNLRGAVDAFHSAIGLAIVCAITTHGGRATGARNDLEVAIPPGMAATGVVLPHQMRTVDIKARNATKLCTVPRTTLQAIRSRLKVPLGLGR